MTLVLQIVKYGDLRTRANDWRREAGVEQDIEAISRYQPRKCGLFPEDAGWPDHSGNGLHEGVCVICVSGNEIGGLAIGDNKVLILLHQFRQQVAQVDLGPAYTAWNQIKR